MVVPLYSLDIWANLLQVFDLNPVAISKHVFAPFASEIMFEDIFAFDDPVLTVPYQLFIREKFAMLCYAVWKYCKNWKGPRISESLPVYDTLRETGLLHFENLGTYEDFPVNKGKGGVWAKETQSGRADGMSHRY